MSDQPENPNREQFFDWLKVALKGDTKRARALHVSLWEGVKEARELREAIDPSDERVRVRLAVRHCRVSAKRAHAITIAAQKLLDLLRSNDPLSPFHFQAPGMCGSLPELIREAEAHEANVRPRAKHPSGRPPDYIRALLSEHVARQLNAVGIRVNAPSKCGLFQRVLAVVQEAAGYRNRTAGNVERDAVRARTRLSRSR